ncbi:unnamed protein product [Dicrocoelium dendriticum]|nr:unnamed protein product [Dicrocoelium dendriticum]
MISGHLAVLLRHALTTRLHRAYFRCKHFYTLNQLVDLDNPDQRFTEDISIACNTLTEILPLFIINPILIIFYTYKCVEKAGWLGPISAFLLFIVFAVLTRSLMTWTSTAVYEQERQEGSFRYMHSQLRSCAESAAFLNLGVSQHSHSTWSLLRLLHAFRVKVNRNAVLYFVTTLSAYTGSILNYLAIGIVLFGGLFGNMTSSEITVLISQTSFFLLYLINKFTSLIELGVQIAALVGVANRILTLNKYLVTCGDYDNPASYLVPDLINAVGILPTSFPPPGSIPPTDGETFLVLEHISIGIPPDMEQILVHDLNLTIRLQDPMLISGPSGVGKTALLRTLADLWPALASDPLSPEASHFYRSPHFKQVFVPQQPFVPCGASCPTELFSILGLSQTSFNIIPEARALHLAYLLLTIAEVPQLRTDSVPTKCLNVEPRFLHSTTAVNNAFLENELTHFDAEECPPGSTLGRYQLCGYSLGSYLKALSLLAEFRLITAAECQRLNSVLIREPFRDCEEIIAKRFCTSVSLCDFITTLFHSGCQPVPRGGGLDGSEWRSSYSPGEMQRLMLASVCYQSPHVAFLDEATSQLNMEDEEQAYISMQSRHITTISVAHRSTVQKYHRQELSLRSYESPRIGDTDRCSSWRAARELHVPAPSQWTLRRY